MKSLILELPGLFDKQLSGVFRESLRQLDLPLLSMLISKADKLSLSSFDGVGYSALEKSGDLNPEFAAKYLNLANKEASQYQYWFRADPVELLTDISTIHLKGNWHFKFSEHQIKVLESNINQCIEHLDAKYYLQSETEGYMGCNQWAEISFVSLLSALGNNQREMAVKGNDASQWRQLQTEIQMSLFGTGGPENISQTKSSVNSIYFWGNPKAELPTNKIDCIVSDSNLILGLAEASEISSMTISAFDSKFNFEEYQSVQLVPMDLLWTEKHGDVMAWNKIITTVETNWMPDILSALSNKTLDEIVLLTGNENYFHLNKSHLKKFWRRNKPLIDFIEG